MGQQRQDDARDQMMTLAWYTAALPRQKKLPSLQSLLTRRRAAAPRQTVAEQRTMLEAIAQQYGLTLGPGRRRHG